MKSNSGPQVPNDLQVVSHTNVSRPPEGSAVVDGRIKVIRDEAHNNALGILDRLVRIPSITRNYEANKQLQTIFSNGIRAIHPGFKEYSLDNGENRTLILSNVDPSKVETVYYFHGDKNEVGKEQYEIRRKRGGILTGAALYDNKFPAYSYLRLVERLKKEGVLDGAPIAFVVEDDEEQMSTQGLAEAVKVINPHALYIVPDAGFTQGGVMSLPLFARGATNIHLSVDDPGSHAAYTHQMEEGHVRFKQNPLRSLYAAQAEIDREFAKIIKSEAKRRKLLTGALRNEWLPSSVEPTVVVAGQENTTNKIPRSVRGIVDVRYNPVLGTNFERLRRMVEAAERIPGVKARIDEQHMQPYLIDYTDERIAPMVDIIRGHGLKPAYVMPGGCTGLSYLPQDEFGRVRAINMRPEGGIGSGSDPDWVREDSLVEVTKMISDFSLQDLIRKRKK